MTFSDFFFDEKDDFDDELENALRSSGVKDIARAIKYSPNKKVTVDFVIIKDDVAHCVFTQASCRERFLLKDRCAMVMRNSDCIQEINRMLKTRVTAYDFWFIGKRENRGDSIEHTVDFFRKKATNFIAIPEDHCFSVFDHERTSSFLNAVT